VSDRTPQERREQVVALAKGDKGDQGERGEQGMTRGARRAIIYLFTLTVVLAGLNLYWTSREVGQVRGVVRTQAAQARVQAAQVRKLRTAVRSSCNFAADLAGAPVAVSPATGKASELGVKIVSDSRVQWRGLGCPGRLAPAQPSFVKWARYYHLPSR
jgi:hypothetical protein